jgi:hypothetical protein
MAAHEDSHAQHREATYWHFADVFVPWVAEMGMAPTTFGSHIRFMITIRGVCRPVLGSMGHQNGSSTSGGAPVYVSDTPPAVTAIQAAHKR